MRSVISKSKLAIKDFGSYLPPIFNSKFYHAAGAKQEAFYLQLVCWGKYPFKLAILLGFFCIWGWRNEKNQVRNSKIVFLLVQSDYHHFWTKQIFFLNVLRDSIFQVSHCIESSQCIKSNHPFLNLKKKIFCPQYIESLNIWSLSLHQVISMYWEIQCIKSFIVSNHLNVSKDFYS